MTIQVNVCQVLIVLNESQQWKSFTQKFQIPTLKERRMSSYFRWDRLRSSETGWAQALHWKEL